MPLFATNTSRKPQPLLSTLERSDAVSQKAQSQPPSKSIDTFIAKGIGQLLRSAKDVLLETVSFALRRTGAINDRQDQAMRSFINKQLGGAIRTLYVDIPKYVAGVKEEEAIGDKPWVIASRVSYRAAQLSIIAMPFSAIYFLTAKWLAGNLRDALYPPASASASSALAS